MFALIFMICMSEITAILVPPSKWWGHITYVITWPQYLGEWIKANLSKPEYTFEIQVSENEEK